MPNIKTRNVVKNTIKTKDNVINIKSKSENAYNSNEENEKAYAVNRLSSFNKSLPFKTVDFIKLGNKSVGETKNNVIKTKDKIKTIKSALTEKRKIKKANKEIKAVYNILQKDKKIAKETLKANKNARRLAKEATKRTYYSLKATVKITMKVLKTIINGLKLLVIALFAFGYIVIMIIIIMCLLAALCSSIYGVFLNSEDVENNGFTISSVIKEINNEVIFKIEEIQNSNIYDEFKVVSNRAEWKDILKLYVAKVYFLNQEVITMNEDKAIILRTIFWDVHNISSEIKAETVTDVTEDNQEVTTYKNILYIYINSKSLEEMINYYNFNVEQCKIIEELSSEDLNELWSNPIHGVKIGSNNMVQVALQEVGNIGGEKYWSWYGFDSRVEWCAIFVSWVANEVGYIENNIIPKFSVVGVGANWFKALGQWKENDYVPKSGDIIFFDWENDGRLNHVGIVERVDNNKVYTIEGNSNDVCKNNSYSLDSGVIAGYGILNY